MVERNTKTLLLEALKETGDDPEEVECNYSRRGVYISGVFVPRMRKCSASDLPNEELLTLVCHSKKHSYKLVKTDREIKIETSPNTDPS